uniref:Hexosaminidase D n=1 Tax=Strigamia maritima TaxID=126957 RepID=T1JFK8_STRMM
MLRTVSERDLQEHLGDGLVEPMVWVYVSHVERFVDPTVWRKFSRVFSTVWGAGAFKGAFGSSLFTVNARRHLECTAEWLRVLRVYGSSFSNGVSGYVLTGWQRYDHFATLCELLPAAVPSLAANLILAGSGGPLEDGLFQNVSSALGCGLRSKRPSLRSLTKNPYMWEYSRCRFPGQRFFRLIRTFKQMRSRINKHVKTVTEEQAWLTAYNVRHNFSSPMRLSEAILWHTELVMSAERLRKDLKQSLDDVFDRHTVVEWLEQNIHPLFQSLAKLDSDARSLMGRDTWPARPLPTDPLNHLFNESRIEISIMNFLKSRCSRLFSF